MVVTLGDREYIENAVGTIPRSPASSSWILQVLIAWEQCSSPQSIPQLITD